MTPPGARSGHLVSTVLVSPAPVRESRVIRRRAASWAAGVSTTSAHHPMSAVSAKLAEARRGAPIAPLASTVLVSRRRCSERLALWRVPARRGAVNLGCAQRWRRRWSLVEHRQIVVRACAPTASVVRSSVLALQSSETKERPQAPGRSSTGTMCSVSTLRSAVERCLPAERAGCENRRMSMFPPPDREAPRRQSSKWGYTCWSNMVCS